MSVQTLLAASKSNPYSTYSYSRKMNTAVTKAIAASSDVGSTTKANTSARTLGLHFENIIIDALYTLGHKDGSIKGGRPAVPNPKAAASINMAASISDKGFKAKAAVEAAGREAAQLIHNQIKSEMELAEQKKFKIDLSGVGGGSDAGDIGIKFGDQTFIFEAKYQTNANALTRWMGKKSKKLFGNELVDFIQNENQNITWNHLLLDEKWQQEIQLMYAQFLGQQYPNPADQVTFLANKGGIPMSSVAGNAKYIIHGLGQVRKTEITLTDMDDLLDILGATNATSASSYYSLGAMSTVDSLAYQKDNQILAQTAISQFSNTNKDGLDFTIELYVSQKLLRR